jgi:hypothetical protein
MEEAMGDVQVQLVFERCPESARLAQRCLRANHDLAMLKRDDVGRAFFVEEAAVKLRNPSVGYQRNAHFARLLEIVWLSRWKS